MFSDARLIFKKFSRIFLDRHSSITSSPAVYLIDYPAPEIMTVRRINDDKWSKWPSGDLLGKQREWKTEFSRTAQVLWKNDHEPSAQDTEGRQAQPWLTSSTLAPLWFLTKASFICFWDIFFFFLRYSHWAPHRHPAEGHGQATGLPPRPQGTTRAFCLLATPYWRVLVCFQFFTLMDTPSLSTLLVIKVVPNFFLNNKTLWNKNPGTCVIVHNWRTLDKFLEVELLGQRIYTFRILELMPK